MARIDKYIIEMAKADMDGVDLSKVLDKSVSEVSPKAIETIVQKYFENYKKRTSKEISPQAIAPFKKLVAEKVKDEELLAKFVAFAKLLVVKKAKDVVIKQREVSESSLYEMAEADFKGIDLEGTPETIAKQFVDNYKKRTGKDFTAQAAAGIKKTLKDRDDIDAIISAARKYGQVKEAKPHAVRSQESNEKKKEQNTEKHDTMSKNVQAAAKKAYDVYTKEDLILDLKKNSGMLPLNEEKDDETAKCPTCGKKYLVKTGYCLSCKKKVADMKGVKASVSTDGGSEAKSKKDLKVQKKKIAESSTEQTYMKDGIRVYRTDSVISYRGSKYKIPKEVVALKDVK